MMRIYRFVGFTGKRIFARQISTRLIEVGKFEDIKLQGKYCAGQLFMHKVFGYRGAILFPWAAKIYDHDALSVADEKPLLDDRPNQCKQLRTETATYYQVLIDQRDCPFIRAQPEAVTFLGDKEDSSLYAIPGLDYVNHEDVLPYISNDQVPIHHELFPKFLAPIDDVPSFTATATLRAWHEKNHRWLELTDVHRETTENIRVTVAPFYMGKRIVQQKKSYWWRYAVRLENFGKDTVHLRERHWRIFSFSGTLETVRGRGVVGQEPLLSPKHPAFQYSSHVSLQSPSGQMWGTYHLEDCDENTIVVRIPPFALESREDEKT